MPPRTSRRAPRVEAPQLPAQLAPFDAAAAVDGDPIEGTEWHGGAPPSPVGRLDVVGSRLAGVRFTGLEVDELTLLDVVVDQCELSGATLAGARCERVAFTGCRMSGVVAAGLRARHARFAGCQLDGAWLRAAVMDHCELVDCDLTGADLYGARLVASRLVRCRLDGAELSALTADQLALHGSTVDGATGLGALQGLVIAGDQVLDLALPVLAARGIRVDDDYLAEPDDAEPG